MSYSRKDAVGIGDGIYRAKLVDAASANGDQGSVDIKDIVKHTFYVSITGTATVTPYFSPDGTTFIAGNPITASGIHDIEILGLIAGITISGVALTPTVNVWWIGKRGR